MPTAVRPFGKATCLAMAALACCAARLPAAGLTPQSPEVRKALERATRFLESTDAPETRVGGTALIGLAVLKNRGGADHPLVKKAADDITQAFGQKFLEDRQDQTGIYSLGLCILFFAELDPLAHRESLERVVKALLDRQKANGAWGYPFEEVGDTSMTQFAVMGLWMAQECGVKVSDEVWVNVCNWLLRTQDPDGGFVYHPADPGKPERMKQVDSGNGRYGVTAGAAGSLYLIEASLGLRRLPSGEDELPVPSGLKRVERPKAPSDDAWRPRPAPAGLDVQRLSQAQRDVDYWMQQNFTVSPPQYKHYYLYALERYQTVRSSDDESPRDKRAGWYDAVARDLLATQNADGSWLSEGISGVRADTAFGMLFLLRSMRRSLRQVERLGDGMLVGGRGLPSREGAVQLSLGAVVPRPLRGPAEDLLAKMEDAAAPEYLRAVQGFEELASTADVQELNRHAVKLRELARAPDAVARRAAVRALGRTGDLQHVPTLVYALSDPDPEISRAADDALRLLSRKFEGVGKDLTLELTINRWKAWYLSIRPDAQFDE